MAGVSIDLAGNHAIVTGGCAGLGNAIAARLVASGASVCIWDIDADGIERAAAALAGVARSANQTVFGAVADVSKPASVESALADTMSRFPSLEIAVNNAGISGPNVKTWEYPLEDWNQVLGVDLTGTFLVSRAVIPLMLERDFGRVVNIASIAGKEGNPNAPAYSAAKAGVIALTKTLGKELSTTGVTVNCVAPAAVRTAIFDQMTDEHIDFMLSKIPMNRFGKPEEIAALVAWMCSSECSFSTGAVYDISGGRAVY